MCPYITEEVRFRNEVEDTILAGTLWLPRAGGPHPAVVLLQGNNGNSLVEMDRNSYGLFPLLADHFARHGIAALCYDRPGAGGSTGHLKNQNLHDRAQEALAAVGFLQARGDVRPQQIGLWGISNGGWVVPLVASLSSDVAFIIPVSAPGITPAEQNVYRIEHQMRQDGCPPDQIEEAVTYARQLTHLWQLMLDGQQEGHEAFKASLPKVEERPWHDRYVGVGEMVLVPNWADRADFVRGQITTLGYDVRIPLRQVRCPVLAIFGEHDPYLPACESAAIFEQALTEGGNRDHTILVFDKADHGIFVSQVNRPNVPAPGYLDAMTHWIERRCH